jgi:hypothetical protein
MAAGAIRFADGIACSKSTAPVTYGRSDRAGAATQARAVISARHTPIGSHFRIVIRKHIVDNFDSCSPPGFAIRSRLQAAAHHKSLRPSGLRSKRERPGSR